MATAKSHQPSPREEDKSITLCNINYFHNPWDGDWCTLNDDADACDPNKWNSTSNTQIHTKFNFMVEIVSGLPFTENKNV